MNQSAIIILDGFGIGPKYAGNAVNLANMKFYNYLLQNYPNSALEASGEAVGLPKEEDGNSEVGHLNLGAGRIVYQDLPKINMSIADGSFFNNQAFLEAIFHAQKNNSALHLFGLIGSGGVHSNIEHLFALLHLSRKNNLKKVYLHLFTDGRDSPPSAALTYIKQIDKEISSNQTGEIASLIGRYYAMDRDKRWDRTMLAYNLITKGEGKVFKTAEEAIKNAYTLNQTDEFIQPSVISKDGDIQKSRVKDNDAVIFFNFRIDRPRQLTKMFVLDTFTEESVQKTDYDPYTEKYYKKMMIKDVNRTPVPERKNKVNNLFFTTMTQYDKNLNCAVAFPSEQIKNSLGEVFSKLKLKQLRISESEKEKMVTYFFSGLRDNLFLLEERIVVPSQQVPTYDQKPEMSAEGITDAFITKIKENSFSLFVVNFANPDMLGHTGNIEKTIEALQVVDKSLEAIYHELVETQGGTMIITADHGNCEEMIDQEGNIDTKHSTFPVPFVFINNVLKKAKARNGVLGDVAPTLLEFLQIQKPEEMTGQNLLIKPSNQTNENV
jgi:2,3-bisphosphoglycerate-independent phosphoglycerate mutase